MSIHHLDVKFAFLYGEMEQEIYMRLPGTYAPSDASVCKLKRSIYGLRQAPRAWHSKLAADLATLGYKPFQHAESIFSRDKNNVKVFYSSMSRTYFYLPRHMKQSNLSKTKLGGSIQSKILEGPTIFLALNSGVFKYSIRRIRILKKWKNSIRIRIGKLEFDSRELLWFRIRS
jgi:hypothetical protein